MVKFINKKEEVIQIQLTPYGKKVFSQGNFDPVGYVFYDDDILYDGEYGIGGEIQNNIVTRIKNTERLSVQSQYESQETNAVTSTNFNVVQLNKLSDANSVFFRPLGSNSPWSDYAPAWNITNISNTTRFSGTYAYISNFSVPVLSASLQNSYLPVNVQMNEFVDGEEVETIVEEHVLESRDEFKLDVQEQNTIFKLNGNYDVEIFKVPEGGSDNDMERLYFVDPNSPTYDTILSQTEMDIFARTLEGGDQEIETYFPRLDNTFVEYYLSVRMDQEIEDAPPVTEGLYQANPFGGPKDPCDTIFAPDTLPT